MKTIIGIVTAIVCLSISTYAVAQTPPSGGGPGNPSCPARFSAGKIDSISDRLLAELVPGASQAVVILNSGTGIEGEPPATFTVPASTWEISMRTFTPSWTELIYNDYSVYSGSGVTGYWNGLDTAGTTTGGTILSDNTIITNGYQKCSAQIIIDLEFAGWFNYPQDIMYEYRGTLQWKYAKYTSQNGQMVGSVYTQPVTWYAGRFTRTVYH